MTLQETVLALATALFVNFDPNAAADLMAPDYIQHNPVVPTGAAAVIDILPVLRESELKITTHRVIAEDDHVVMHNTFENAEVLGAATLVTFDVFRVKDGRVVEHWDNLQAPPTSTASGRSMTDGSTEITDLDKTAENKTLVENFLQDVFLDGKLDKAMDYIIAASGAYLQHNPLVADGLDKLAEAFAQMAAEGKAFSFSRVHMVVAQGNFVFSMTEGAIGETPAAFFDLWRVEDGMIVEHWDTISPLPTEWAHENGKF